MGPVKINLPLSFKWGETQLSFNWTRCSEAAIKVLAKQSDLDDKRNLRVSTANSIKRCCVSIWEEFVSCTKEWLQCYDKSTEAFGQTYVCSVPRHMLVCVWLVKTSNCKSWNDMVRLKSFSWARDYAQNREMLPHSLECFYYPPQSTCPMMDAVHFEKLKYSK